MKSTANGYEVVHNGVLYGVVLVDPDNLSQWLARDTSGRDRVRNVNRSECARLLIDLIDNDPTPESIRSFTYPGIDRWLREAYQQGFSDAIEAHQRRAATPRAEGLTGAGHGSHRLGSVCLECERLAATPPAEGLDVERLAEAWANVMDGRRIGTGLNAARIGRDTTTADDWLAIDREYAALAPEQPE